MPEKKTDIARKLFEAGQIKEALKIAASFRLGLSKPEMAALSRGYECFVRPEFYASLGNDPETCIEEAKRVFREKFLSPSPVGV